MRIEFTDDSERALEEFTNGFEQYKKKLKSQVFRALTLLEAEILQNIRKGAGLHVRTGTLLNSIGASKKVVEDSNGFIYGEIGPEGVPYAAIHEFGGTIVPKNAKALAIPTRENQRPDGLPKITTQDLKNGLVPSFVNKGIIFGIFGGKGKTAEAMALFILKSSVTIPARPYLSTAVAKKKEEIYKEFGLLLDVAFPSKG